MCKWFIKKFTEWLGLSLNIGKALSLELEAALTGIKEKAEAFISSRQWH